MSTRFLHFLSTKPLLHQQIKSLSASRVCSGWKNFCLDDELTREVKESIEKKWHSRVYGVDCPAEHGKELNKPNPIKASRYILPMFPYPSGRLHLGHVRVYTLSDVLARYHRMQGHTVIHPMGWDAFGLPAENAAREHAVDAEKWTRENISHMRKQILEMGCCFDWDREFATCDPSYYKWTQWLFSELLDRGLAYKKRAFVYWDPVDKTVLAEEQVDSERRSWRSGAKVEKKLLRQWFIKTTVFAQKLSQGLTSGKLKLGWRDVVALQNHWIGEIKGHFTDCCVDMKDLIELTEDERETSTIEPLRLWFSDLDALRSAKFVILRGDHFLMKGERALKKEFQNGYKLLNFKIRNPINGVELPVISGVSERLPWVPDSCDCRVDEYLSAEEFPEIAENEALLQDITSLVNSVEDSTISSSASSNTDFEYYPASLRLRDWLVSRQRNWGTPIPAMHCLNCGQASIVEKNRLPVSNCDSAKLGSCSHCGSSNVRLETDTLDTFFDSSWYFFRFLDPHNESAFSQSEKLTPLPVHTYVGGKEHATLHLYYARFVTQFLNSLGLSPVTEPFEKLIPIGMVLGEAYIVKGSGRYVTKDECEQVPDCKKLIYKNSGDPVYTKWEKMSKSKYNGIDPDTVLGEFGIDMTRLLTMAEAAPTSPRKWPPNNPEAFLNWQRKVWLLLRQFVDAKDFGDIAFIDDEVWQKSESEIFDNRNFYLKGINHDYSVTSQISVVISRLQAMLGYLKKVPKSYMKESIEFERCLGAGIICLYPIMPAFSAQLWQSFRDVASFTEPEFNLDYEVWEQQWPQVDWRYGLDLICKVKGEEIIVKVERNYLDNMDEATAVQIALDQPNVRKLIPAQCEVSSFTIEPSFRAVLSLREKRPNNDANPPNNTNPSDNTPKQQDGSSIKQL